MKHISRIAIVSSIAVLALASCQKNEFVPEYTTTEGLTFTSVKPALEDETKTAWTGTTIQWSMGDAIRVAYTCDGVWQNADGNATADEKSGSKTAKAYQSTALLADAEKAQFSVPGDFKGTAEGSYVFYGAYPASACTDGTDFKHAPSLTVTIPITQTPAADSFDSTADFMLGKSVSTYTGIPTEAVSMSWDRMVAHAQLTFKALNGFSAGETISKVELKANSEADMVGKHYIYLDTKKVTKPNSTIANALTLKGTNLSVDETGTFVAWASFLPCTVKSLTVVVTTDKATYTREISSCELVFKKNARNTLTIKMDGAVRAELAPQQDYSGEWLIAGLNETNYYAAQKWVSGNNLKGLSIIYDGKSVTRVEGIDACKMVFTKVEDGTYAGMYTIEDASSTEETKSYLYAASSSKNYMKVQTSLDINSYWSIIENEDGTFRIIAEKSSNNNLMRFNYNNGSPLFSCYEDKSGATGTDVLLIPYSAIAVDTRTQLTTPAVSAKVNSTTTNSIDVEWNAVANAGSYEITATPADGAAVSKTVTKTVTAVDNTTTYTCTIEGLAYETGYIISVVAKPSNTGLYKDSEPGVYSETVKTGTNPSTGGEIVTLFTEGFGNNTGSARVWSDKYKEQSGISSVYSSSTYTISNAKQSKNTQGKTNSALAQSTTGTDAVFEVKSLNVSGYSDLTVSYFWKAGSIKETYSTSLYYSIDNGVTYTEVKKDSGTGATSFVEVKYTLPAAAVSSNLCLKVIFNTSNARAHIDDFVLKGTN